MLIFSVDKFHEIRVVGSIRVRNFSAIRKELFLKKIQSLAYFELLANFNAKDYLMLVQLCRNVQPNISNIARPLTDVLQKNKKSFNFSENNTKRSDFLHYLHTCEILARCLRVLENLLVFKSRF